MLPYSSCFGPPVVSTFRDLSTMARAAGATRQKKTFANKKASNVAGYTKRKSLKGKALVDASDVYEFQPEKVRRAKVKLLLEKDELQDDDVPATSAGELLKPSAAVKKKKAASRRRR